MRWAFTGIVRPMISYGSIVWAHCLKVYKERLRRLNRLAINTFCSIPQSTPTRFLEIALDVMPLDLFCEQEALKSYCRLNKKLEFGWDGTAKRKTFNTSHIKHWKSLLNKCEGWDIDSDSIKIKIWECEFEVDLDSYKINNGKLITSQYNVFTDGSKMENNTGSDFVIMKGHSPIIDDRFKLPEYATVFQAEIMAISKAVDSLKQNTNFKYVKFFVDSQAALLALKLSLIHI